MASDTTSELPGYHDDPPVVAPGRCLQCAYVVEADDIAIRFPGRTADGLLRGYCVRCYHLLVGDAHPMAGWLRREIERIANRDEYAPSPSMWDDETTRRTGVPWCVRSSAG